MSAQFTIECESHYWLYSGLIRLIFLVFSNGATRMAELKLTWPSFFITIFITI